MTYDIKVCRCCGRYVDRDDAIKYSTRHYAHVRCYFDAGKPAEALSTLQLKKLIRQHSLTAPVAKQVRELLVARKKHDDALAAALQRRVP